MKRGYFQSSPVLCVLSLLVLLPLTLLVVGCLTPNPPSTHRQPTANFTMNHNSGQAPLIVQFEDASNPEAAAPASLQPLPPGRSTVWDSSRTGWWSPGGITPGVSATCRVRTRGLWR